MSFFSTFGKKVSGAVHHLGQKAKQVVTKGTKFVADHSLQIAGIAHKVHDVAGTVSKVAGTIATGAALVGAEPIAALAGGVAGVAKGVEKGAGVVGSGASAIAGARQAQKSGEEALKAIRSGNIGGAIEAGKGVKAGVDLARTAGGNFRKQIERKK